MKYEYTDFDTPFLERHGVLVVIVLVLSMSLYAAWPLTTLLERVVTALPR